MCTLRHRWFNGSSIIVTLGSVGTKNLWAVCCSIGRRLGALQSEQLLYLVRVLNDIAPAVLAMFLMGAWTSRSAGCIINDYLDRNFDRSVERCKDRPLASGEVTIREAAGLLFLNLCGGLYVLTQLPLPALLATFAILPVAALYPLAKRYTRYPQFILGLAFNSGVIIGALTLAPSTLNWLPTVLIYCSGICWTMVYDTVYAYQVTNLIIRTSEMTRN